MSNKKFAVYKSNTKKLADELRKRADELEEIQEQLDQHVLDLEEETEYMRPRPEVGIVAPWDARKTQSPGGYDCRDGSKGLPSRTVSGKAWGTLCVCPNVETAKFITHAINEYLKTVQPETMFVETTERHEDVLMSEAEIKKLQSKWKNDASRKKYA